VKLGKYSYYIFNAKDKRTIIGDVDDIFADSFIQEKSNYFIVEKQQLGQAIFDKDGNQISKWFDYIEKYGLVEGRSDYYVARKNNKKAVFDKDGKRVTKWFKSIGIDGLVDGQSDYYIAVNKDDKEAIFHKNGKRMSKWFKLIGRFGLVDGESDYYIAKNKYDKVAIFHKSGKRMSKWFNEINSHVGLVTGQSDYYIAVKRYLDHGVREQAIFNKDGHRVSDWIIVPSLPIFNKDGHRVSDGMLVIFGILERFSSEYGLVEGKSPYYVTPKKGYFYIHKVGSSKSLGPFVWIDDYGFIRDSSKNTIRVEISKGQYKTLTKQEVEQFFRRKRGRR
jgi:phage anti-repressor protein